MPPIPANGVRIGELDEEFIYERRDRRHVPARHQCLALERIEADRVLVTPAEGAPAMVPFWRGENAGRSYDLGLCHGQFLRELADRLDAPDCLDWLRARLLPRSTPRPAISRCHVRRQLRVAGPSADRPTPGHRGIPRSARRLAGHPAQPAGRPAAPGPAAGAGEPACAQRLGYRPQCLHHNDGILIRLTDTDEPVLDCSTGLTPENVEALDPRRAGRQCPVRPAFPPERGPGAAAAARQAGQAGAALAPAAARPRLLQVARRHPDFPIVAETFRECLHDHLDLPRLQQLLADIRAGTVEGA